MKTKMTTEAGDKNTFRTIYSLAESGVRPFSRMYLREYLESDIDEAESMFRMVNRLSAAYNYDPMKIALGILMGTERSIDEFKEYSAQELLQYLTRVLTAVDIILSIKDKTQRILEMDQYAPMLDTILRDLKLNKD